MERNKNDALNDLTRNSSKILDEIKMFHKDVFGEEDEDGNFKGGLKMNSWKEDLS